MSRREFAVVTGASTGIGPELARCAAAEGCDLLLCADERAVEQAAAEIRRDFPRIEIHTLEADLGTQHGMDRLWEEAAPRGVDYLCANAGRGLGHAFLDQDWDEIEAVIHTNVTGTTSLLHRMSKQMAMAGKGRILVTGSVAGLIPGSYLAVYNATKAYLDTLCWGIREELKDRGVSVTCLMPGPTETEFFERAQMQDTPMGRDPDKDDPRRVARQGWRAMKKGKPGVTTGFARAAQAALAGVLPDEVLARLHRDMAEPEEEKARHG